MSTRDIGFKNERIERLMRDRTGEKRWLVTEAKMRLSAIVHRARGGTNQLVGKRDPVIVISVGELESLFITFSKPETWGEFFSPRISEKGLGAALELPVHSRRITDSYDLKGYHEDGFATDDVATGRPRQKHGDE